jgi:hypothetical protein
MYDTVKLSISTEIVPNINFLRDIPQYLTNVVDGIGRYGKYVTGYLDNLEIGINENQVSIYKGSLCKNYLGENFRTLTISDTQRAIEKISDNLHLPFHLANVTRLDFGTNIILNHPETCYYPYLGEAPYYDRRIYDNGLQYIGSKKALSLYGKIIAQKRSRKLIPQPYMGLNILRYELKFMKGLRKQFNLPFIGGATLYEVQFYSMLMDRWKNEYLHIQKINNKTCKMIPTGSTRELIENMALFQLLDMGQAEVLAAIKGWQQMGLITKKQANDHRAKIKLLAKTPIDEKGNELIKELDQKINEIANG